MGRVLTRFRQEQRRYFLRQDSSIIDEYRVPSNRHFEIQLDFAVGFNWQYTQLGQDMFFFRGQRRCGLLKNKGSSRFTCLDKADMLEERNLCQAICLFKDSFIFVSGGYNMRSVERYDIGNDKWELMPDLTEERWYHASVVQGGTVYVLCGFNGSCDLDDLESLDTAQLASGGARWQRIRIATAVLTPREQPVAASLNDREIVILGGAHDGYYLDDVVIVDAKELICSDSGQLKVRFRAEQNINFTLNF